MHGTAGSRVKRVLPQTHDCAGRAHWCSRVNILSRWPLASALQRAAAANRIFDVRHNQRHYLCRGGTSNTIGDLNLSQSLQPPSKASQLMDKVGACKVMNLFRHMARGQASLTSTRRAGMP